MSNERIVIVHRKNRVFDGFFKVDEIEATYSRLGGGEYIRNSKWLVLERGDSASALVHDVERDVIVLTEQFRMPTYEKGPGWLIETVAGAIQSDETPEQSVRREMMEEMGYRASELTLISRFYVSPGGTSERIFLFYAPLRTADLIDPDASGVAEQHEDIRRIEIPRADFIAGCREGRFEDAKLLLAGYWLAAGGADAR